MVLPRPVRKLIESFEKLPGIGPKTASRLSFYLLHVPQEQLDEFGEALMVLKKDTVLCSICFNVSETDPCPICSSRTRDKTTICVVEQPLDVLALEKGGSYHGVYHVLHGAISPLENIGPDEIKINELIQRIQHSEFIIHELILATDPDMEGEATAMYIAKKVRELKANDQRLKTIAVTRLGQGLPTGANLEYADELTLTRAMEGRREY
jgi:recombination protein RecR